MKDSKTYDINLFDLKENIFFQKMLGEFLAHNSDIDFIESKEKKRGCVSVAFEDIFILNHVKYDKENKYYYFNFEGNEIGINMSHNLIQKTNEKNVYRFYTKEIMGKGASKVVKNIIGEIIVKDGMALLRECNDYALIIRNSNHTYNINKLKKSRKKIGKEKLNEANMEYDKNEIFSYLNLEKPVERIITKNNKKYSKIYTVMKKFNPIILDDISQNTSELIKLSIKILESYQSQIAKTNYIHLVSSPYHRVNAIIAI
jgi:hypothetical protein